MAIRHDYLAQTAADRFWSKVDTAGPVPEHRPSLGPCWLWTATTTPNGYGYFKVGGRMVLAYRWAWQELFGPIPEGLQPDHLCRTRLCVRPSHLELVTPRENTLRGVSFAARNARTTHCPRGHEYTEANTRLYRGRRYCRACNNNGGRGRQAGPR
jgi:hypothetical protein